MIGNSDIQITTEPFHQDTYWVIASTDLTEFMAADVTEFTGDAKNPPYVVFFEQECDARKVHAMVPMNTPGADVVRVPQDRCLDLTDMLMDLGWQVAIALKDGNLMVLNELPQELPGEV